MDRIPGFYYRFLGSRMLVSVVYEAFLIYFLWAIVVRFQSVFLAGMIATISVAVELISAIPIGHLIDRVNSTTVGLFASIVGVAGVFLMVFGESLFIIYSATGMLAISFTMKGDAFSATIKKHLGEEQFQSANSSNQAVIFASSLIGTGIGGGFILYLSNYFPYALLLILIVSCLSAFPIYEKVTREAGSQAIQEIASAIRFLKRILGFITVAFVLNGLFISLNVYSSGLFHIVLKVSSIYYIAFIVAISVGGISGAWIGNKVGGRVSNAFVLSFLVLMYAPLFLLLGLSRSSIIDIVDAFTIGVLVSVVNIPLQTKLMKIIPHNIFGKIMAFLRVFLGGATPVMAAILSFAAIYFPVDRILLFIGIISFPVAALAFVALPRFMRMIDTGQTASVTESGPGS